jgi:hypothetical protein
MPVVLSRRILFSVAAALMAEAAAAADSGPSSARNTLWVWHRTHPGELVRLAVQYRVARLLVWVSPGFTADQGTCSWLDQLARAAGSRAIALDALCGDPSWAEHPALAGAWAAEVGRSGRFGRVHIDIEPHALPNWGEASADLTTGLVMAVVAARRAAGLPVDVDIPAWYWTVKTTAGPTADVAILDVADSITLMSYQNTPGKVTSVSQPEMRTAAKARKPAYIGVNLMEPPPDDPGSSLWNQPPSVIRACIDEVGRATAPYFAGVAIHEAASLARL